MARHPRIDLPGIAQHIVQRGNNRQACFATDADYGGYLRELAEAASKHGCAIHAYVLMTNHVHVLATPAEAGAIARMMQAIGRRYVGCFNARYGRTGTLWEGRYKAALVGSQRYVLACYRYIELNPVRAGMVSSPEEYRWSSHGHNALGARQSLITAHPSYMALASDDTTRYVRYRQFIAARADPDEAESIHKHTAQQRVFGNERFQAQIAALTGLVAMVRSRGRPKADPHRADTK